MRASTSHLLRISSSMGIPSCPCCSQLSCMLPFSRENCTTNRTQSGNDPVATAEHKLTTVRLMLGHADLSFASLCVAR